jgi:hypothetical protein
MIKKRLECLLKEKRDRDGYSLAPTLDHDDAAVAAGGE